MTAATATRKPARKPARKKLTDAAKAKAKAARQEKADALHATLAAQVDSMASSEQWTAYLKFSQSFHRYSFTNMMLIWSQCPTATQVAGYGQWQEKGRQVVAGAKSIAIFGYASKLITEEDEKTGEKVKKRVTFFPTRRVFDIADTEPITEDMIDGIRKGTERRKGNPKAKVWTGETENPTRLLEGEDELGVAARVAAHIETLGWTMHYVPRTGGANGRTMLDGSKRVEVVESMSPAAQAKTALHELAHLLMHADVATGERNEDGPQERDVRELEAEATAYVVAGALGFDTSDYSIGYLTGWAGGKGDAVAATAERVLKTAKTILDDVFPVAEPETDDQQD